MSKREGLDEKVEKKHLGPPVLGRNGREIKVFVVWKYEEEYTCEHMAREGVGPDEK